MLTVPRAWCHCTAAGSTGTYATIYGYLTDTNGPCSYTQDAFPAGTISPSPATCMAETAVPGSSFFNALAWCACGENALYPLLPQTTTQIENPNLVDFCGYTAQPTSTITASTLASTSCQETSIYGLATSVCACHGQATSILYPTGTQNCVFSSVPTTTASLPTLAGQQCDRDCPYNLPCYTCERDGKTVVSRHSETEVKRGNANRDLFSGLSATRHRTTLHSVLWNTVLLGIHVLQRVENSRLHHRAVFPYDRRKLRSYGGELRVLVLRAWGEDSSSLFSHTIQPLSVITISSLPPAAHTPTYWGPVHSPSSVCLYYATTLGTLKLAYCMNTAAPMA